VTGDGGVFFCPKKTLTSSHDYGNNFANYYLFFEYTPMTTKTLEQFTTALEAAFEEVSSEDLKKLLESWEWKNVDEDPLEDNLNRIKTLLKNQFESWPDILKDKVTISLEIDENLDDSHRFLSFKGADLTGADLTGADLIDTDLRDAILRGAILSDADLINAILSGADLRDAILSGADLWGADLRDAILTGAILTGATTTLTRAKGLVVDEGQNEQNTVPANSGTVSISKNTKLPNDLLCCYFNRKLYQNDTENSGFIDNPITFENWEENFVKKFTDASDPNVTPPGSRFNLNVSGNINEWIAAMRPALKEAWDERQKNLARLAIEKAFLNLEMNQQS
jgi:hypothetical protein